MTSTSPDTAHLCRFAPMYPISFELSSIMYELDKSVRVWHFRISRTTHFDGIFTPGYFWLCSSYELYVNIFSTTFDFLISGFRNPKNPSDSFYFWNNVAIACIEPEVHILRISDGILSGSAVLKYYFSRRLYLYIYKGIVFHDDPEQNF